MIYGRRWVEGREGEEGRKEGGGRDAEKRRDKCSKAVDWAALESTEE